MVGNRLTKRSMGRPDVPWQWEEISQTRINEKEVNEHNEGIFRASRRTFPKERAELETWRLQDCKAPEGRGPPLSCLAPHS